VSKMGCWKEGGWLRRSALHHSTMARFWRKINKLIADKNVVVANIIITNVSFF
jgi:hypothetical protein